MFSCPFMICFEVSAISYFKLTHLENIKSYIFLKWPSLVCFQSANFIFVLFKQQFTGKMCRPFINKNSYLKLRIKKFLWRTGALALQCWWWLMFERLWVGILALYTGWTWHFFTLIFCKNCIVCLKRPKRKEKEYWYILEEISICCQKPYIYNWPQTYLGSDCVILKRLYNCKLRRWAIFQSVSPKRHSLRS